MVKQYEPQKTNLDLIRSFPAVYFRKKKKKGTSGSLHCPSMTNGSVNIQLHDLQLRQPWHALHTNMPPAFSIVKKTKKKTPTKQTEKARWSLGYSSDQVQYSHKPLRYQCQHFSSFLLKHLAVFQLLHCCFLHTLHHFPISPLVHSCCFDDWESVMKT